MEHREEKVYTPLRAFSFVVLLLMATAIIYATAISIHYWSGIGV